MTRERETMGGATKLRILTPETGPIARPIRALQDNSTEPRVTLRAQEENRAAVTGVEVPGNIPTVGGMVEEGRGGGRLLLPP